MNGNIDFIVKLGGSAITYKDRFETFKSDQLRQVCQLLKKCQLLGHNFIVVHGAGSFGHHQAKEFEVNSGFHKAGGTRELVKKGFCETRLSVTKLNHIITSELIRQGLNAVSISPCNGWTTDNGKVCDDAVTIVTDLLSNGFVPVLHGDCVLDKQNGCHILSGDTIIKVLCIKMHVKQVVFLMDIKGIYDQPPNKPGAKLIKQITVDEDGEINLNINTSKAVTDVTGGVKLKLQCAIDIVTNSRKTDVLLCEIGSQAAQDVLLHSEMRDLEFTKIRARVLEL